MCAQGGLTKQRQKYIKIKQMDSNLWGKQAMTPTLIKTTIISGILAITANSAIAAEVGRGNHSEPLVWGFLGLCALIILAQIAPLILNLKKQSKVAAEQAKAVKQHQL